MSPTEGVGIRLTFSTEPGTPITVFQRNILRVAHQKSGVACVSFFDDPV